MSPSIRASDLQFPVRSSFLGCHSAWKAVSVCIIYYANFPGKFCGKQDMRAWRDCGTLRAHKSPQSMYYIGELRTIRPHPSPPVPHPNSKGKFSLGIEEIRLPPSELFISPPSTPFLESGVSVGSAAIAKLLCSYSTERGKEQ